MLGPSPAYHVKIARLNDGERFALLVDGRTGLPVPETTRYSAVFRRSREGSVSTMVNELRAIAIAMNWVQHHGINLDQRVEGVHLFTQEELLSLRDALRAHQHAWESARCQLVVSSATHYQRCLYVRDFIAWRTERAIHRIHEPVQYRAANDRLAQFKRAFLTLLPSPKQRSREGLSPEAQARFREIIRPHHPENPFQRAHRERNYALLLLYFDLGMRLAEALVLKGADLNLSPNQPTVTIHRRADDPSDRRSDPPLTKTAGRILPIGEELRKALETFVLDHRRKYPGAKRTPFVFVSRTGNPIARRTVVDMFLQIKRRCPDLPPDLSAHILRHSWNDRYSELADELGMSEADEVKTRSYLQGWKETSGRAVTYTKRSTRRQADKHILELQRKSLRGANQ